MIVLLGGCQALPDVTYETRRVELATDFDAPVCSGTLDELDAHIDRVEAALGHVPGRHRFRGYWLEDGVDDFCGDGRSGCFFPSTRVFFARAASIDHELVHAILDSEGESYFVEEGLAELLSGKGVMYESNPDTPGPAAHLRLSRAAYRRGGLDYPAAAHFMQFVHAQAGTTAVRRLGREIEKDPSPSQVRAVLEEVFDASVDEIDSRYRSQAPRHYPGLAQSRVPTLAVDASQTTLTMTLDCSEVDTFGPLPIERAGMYRVVRLEPPWAGRYDVTLASTGQGWVDLFDPNARLGKGWLTDWNRPDSIVDPDASRIRPGQHLRLDLQATPYLLVFATDEPDPITLQLRITPPADPDPPADGPTRDP